MRKLLIILATILIIFIGMVRFQSITIYIKCIFYSKESTVSISEKPNLLHLVFQSHALKQLLSTWKCGKTEWQTLSNKTRIFRNRFSNQVIKSLRNWFRVYKLFLERKFAKKDIFLPVSWRLIQMGGGNASSLWCNSTTEIFGASQTQNLSNVLSNCQAEIQSNCDKTILPFLNVTFIAG